MVAWAVKASEVCFCLVGSNIVSHHLRTGVPGCERVGCEGVESGGRVEERG